MKKSSAKLLAVFNITEGASFTGDGGDYISPDGDGYYSRLPAIEKILRMVRDGANIIDLGAEAMCPGSKPVTSEQEIARLARVLPDLIKRRGESKLPFLISIDTRNSETAKWAIGMGADIINDVAALEDNRMKELAAANKHVTWVYMHNLGTPPIKTVTVPRNQDVVDVIYQWAERKMEEFKRFGIDRSQLVFDPGIAFGKTALQSLELVHRAGEFRSLGTPTCFGHSRKSYFTPLTDQSLAARDDLTAALSRYLVTQGVEYLRVHDIPKNREAVDGRGSNILPEGWYQDFRLGLIERSSRRNSVDTLRDQGGTDCNAL